MNIDSKKLTCGAFAAVNGIIVGYPLDTIKTRLQILGSKAVNTKASHKPYYPPLYSSSMDCLIKTVRLEGTKGLFKGLTITLLGQTPIFCLGFIGIDTGKIIAKLLPPPTQGAFSFRNWSIATCISGGVTTLLMTPAERIKCTLQIQAVGTTHRHHNNGTWDCIKHLWRTGGIRNLYKGLGITYVRGITQAGVYLGTSDTIIAMMTPSSGKMSPGRSMITGGMCGMLVWAAILPIDTVKTIIQTEPEGPRKSAKQIVFHMMTTEGIPGFYKGLVPVVMRAMIFNVVTFSSFTLFYSILKEM